MLTDGVCWMKMGNELEPHHKELMIPQWKVKRRVARMAQDFYSENQGSEEEILFVTVLTGGAAFAEQFLGELANHGENERYLKDEVRVESYGGGMLSNEKPKVTQPLKHEENVKGRKVVILEDIRDTGYSLEELVSYLGSLGAVSTEIIALLSKPAQEKVHSTVKTTFGFEIPPDFVVGFGIDWSEHYRVLNGIWKIVKHESGVTEDERWFGAKWMEKVNLWIDRKLA